MDLARMSLAELRQCVGQQIRAMALFVALAKVIGYGSLEIQFQHGVIQLVRLGTSDLTQQQ